MEDRRSRSSRCTSTARLARAALARRVLAAFWAADSRSSFSFFSSSSFFFFFFFFSSSSSFFFFFLLAAAAAAGVGGMMPNSPKLANLASFLWIFFSRNSS